MSQRDSELREEIVKRAKERFLSNNPALAFEISSLKASEAEMNGVSLEKLQDLRIVDELRKHAENKKINPSDLILELGVDDEQERTDLRRKNAEQMAAALGITWSEYLESNPRLKDKM